MCERYEGCLVSKVLKKFFFNISSPASHIEYIYNEIIKSRYMCAPSTNSNKACRALFYTCVFLLFLFTNSYVLITNPAEL